MKIQNLKFIVKVLGTSVAALFVGVLQAEACKMSRDQKFNYFIDSSINYSGMFWEGRRSVFSPTVIENCQQSAGQYLMLSLGVRFPTPLSETSDISFDGKIEESICRIKDAPMALQSYDEKKDLFSRRHEILRQCTHLQVYDLENRPIQFKPDQKNCKIRSIGQGLFRMDGDFCFLKVSPSNRYVVSIVVNEECKNTPFLREKGISAQDVEAALNAYLVGDDSGSSTDIDPLGSSRARLYFQPSEKEMPLTEFEDERSPRFPTVYAPDIHMGDIAIQGSGETWTLDLSLFVDNRGGALCQQGICPAIGNFNVPVVGEASLYKVGATKREMIDSWWHAGVAVAQWQGLLGGMSKNINEIKMTPGDRYSLEVVFVDPYEDYQLFASAFKQFLIDLKAVEGTAGIDVIQSLQGLQDLAGLSPLRALPSLTSGDFTAELERVLYALSGLNKDRQWPAYYEKVCSPVLRDCVVAGKAKYFMKLKADFTIGSVDEFSGAVRLEDIVVSRDSKISASYSKAVQNLPRQVCGEGE